MDPSRPNKAPEAPTEMLFLRRRAERTLPPNPDSKYVSPIRTERQGTNDHSYREVC